MSQFINHKEIIKRHDRETTIKHYVLGYILECIASKDSRVINNITKFLVYDLNVLTIESFNFSLTLIKSLSIYWPNSISKNYRYAKNSITILYKEKTEQIEIINAFESFNKQYKNGIYIKSTLIQTSLKKEI